MTLSGSLPELYDLISTWGGPYKRRELTELMINCLRPGEPYTTVAGLRSLMVLGEVDTAVAAFTTQRSTVFNLDYRAGTFGRGGVWQLAASLNYPDIVEAVQVPGHCTFKVYTRAGREIKLDTQGDMELCNILVTRLNNRRDA